MKNKNKKTAEQLERDQTLITACLDDNLQLMDKLLKQGADPNVPRTAITPWPLLYCLTMDQFPDVEKIAILLKHGASIDNDASKGGSILLHACEKANFQYGSDSFNLIELLLEHKADLSAENLHTGQVPVSLSAERGLTQVVELFLNKGAPLVGRSRVAKHALVCAAERGEVECLQLLLSHPFSKKEITMIHINKALKASNMALINAEAMKALLLSAKENMELDQITKPITVPTATEKTIRL